MKKIGKVIFAKLKEDFNNIDWYYGPDYDPNKKVFRYGREVTLEQINAYDDKRYGNPDIKMFQAFLLRNGAIGLGAIGAVGLTGYGVIKLGSHLKSKYDAKKKEEEEPSSPTV